MPLRKKVAKGNRGEIGTLPSSNTRWSGHQTKQKGGEAPIIGALPSTLKQGKKMQWQRREIASRQTKGMRLLQVLWFIRMPMGILLNLMGQQLLRRQPLLILHIPNILKEVAVQGPFLIQP